MTTTQLIPAQAISLASPLTCATSSCSVRFNDGSSAMIYVAENHGSRVMAADGRNGKATFDVTIFYTHANDTQQEEYVARAVPGVINLPSGPTGATTYSSFVNVAVPALPGGHFPGEVINVTFRKIFRTSPLKHTLSPVNDGTPAGKLSFSLTKPF